MRRRCGHHCHRSICIPCWRHRCAWSKRYCTCWSSARSIPRRSHHLDNALGCWICSCPILNRGGVIPCHVARIVSYLILWDSISRKSLRIGTLDPRNSHISGRWAINSIARRLGCAPGHVGPRDRHTMRWHRSRPQRLSIRTLSWRQRLSLIAVAVSSIWVMLDGLHQHHQKSADIPSLPQVHPLRLLKHSTCDFEWQHHKNLHTSLVQPCTPQHAACLESLYPPGGPLPVLICGLSSSTKLALAILLISKSSHPLAQGLSDSVHCILHSSSRSAHSDSP